MSDASYDSFVDILKQERKILWIFLVYTLLIILLWDTIDLKTWILGLQSQHWPWYLGFFFSFLYVIRGFFYFPSLYFVMASSLIFSFPFSALYYLIGVFLSAMLSYQIGYHVRKRKHFPKLLSFVEQPTIQSRIKKGGLRSVFWFHLTGVSLDIPNYLSGYLRLPFLKFLATIVVCNLITAGVYFTLFYAGLLTFLY